MGLILSGATASAAPTDHTAVEQAALRLLGEPRFQEPKGWQWGSFKNADGATIRYGWARTSSARGVVALLPGFQSPIEAFFETANDLLAKGFDVWILDWRGQGGSQRWLPNRQKSDSAGFDHDERDFVAMAKRLREREPTLPLFMVGESYGGHIGLRVLHDHAGLVRAAAFSSPAIAFQTGATPSWLVRLMSDAMVTVGLAGDYAQGQGDWSFDSGAGGPANPTADDRARSLMGEAWLLKNPALREGGATWRYVHEFYRSSDLELSPGWMSAVATPVLIGEVPDDKIAVASAMVSSCKAMRNCVLMEFKGTKHTLFKDRDPVRSRFIDSIVTFFTANRDKRQ